MKAIKLESKVRRAIKIRVMVETKKKVINMLVHSCRWGMAPYARDFYNSTITSFTWSSNELNIPNNPTPE